MLRRLFSTVPLLAVACIIWAGEAKDTLTLTLQEAIGIALSDNPTVKVADKDVELKKVASRETWQSLLPEASVGVALDHTIQAAEMKLNDMSFKMGYDGSNTMNAGLTISLPLFVPGVYKAMQMTKTDIELSVEKSRASRQDLVNQVTKAYYQLLLAQDSYEVMKRSYALSEENYEVVSAKYEHGKVSEYDKISAEVQMRSIKPSMVSAGNAIRLAGLNLKVLMGINSDLQIKIMDSLAAHENAMYEASDDYRGTSLEGNSTLRQMELSMKMLNKNIQTQRMNFLPTLGMNFTYNYQSLYNKNIRVFDYDWAGSASLMFNLSIPIYRAGNFTRMKTAKLKLNQLEWNRADVERKISMEAESYRNNMDASSEQVMSNKENVKQAEKALSIAEKRYEVGNGTILELNSSQMSLTQAKLVYNQSIYDYLVAKADLDKVLGKGIFNTGVK